MLALMVAPVEGDVKAKAGRQKAKGKRSKGGHTDPVCFFYTRLIYAPTVLRGENK
jgi:hypothetical protein